MAEENPQGQQQQVSAMIDDREARTVLVNGYRFGQSAEGAILELLYQFPNLNYQPGAPQQVPQVIVKVVDRVIMNLQTAKRLSQSLQQLIKRYEQQFGEIPVQGPVQN